MLKATLTAAMLALSTGTAFAAPWDVDMVDSDAYRGYECWEYSTDENGKRVCVRSMGPIPEGVIAQKNLLTPNHIISPDYPKGDNRWDAVTSPFEHTDATLATGARMYDVYCSICHGKAMEDGTVGAAGLDVFEVEPLAADNPLRKFDNTIFGTHNGSNTVDAVRKVSNLAIEKIAGFLNG